MTPPPADAAAASAKSLHTFSRGSGEEEEYKKEEKTWIEWWVLGLQKKSSRSWLTS